MVAILKLFILSLIVILTISASSRRGGVLYGLARL